MAVCHNLAEWNHCQPTQVKIILPERRAPILRLDSFNVSASERAAVSTFIDSTQEWPPTKEE